MSEAMKLLDSRSFRNKLDYFVSVASRKRPKPSDDELAEAFQPILDAARDSGGVVQAPKLNEAPVPPLTAEERAIPAKVKGIIERMDDWIAMWAPEIQRVPMDAKGVRWVNVPEDTPIAELTGYLQDKEDAPFFIDPSEMTMMNVQRGGWVLPCRTR